MKRTIARRLASSLAALLLVPSLAHAASFPDVSGDHWARVYIEELSNRNILTGDPEGTFRPEDQVGYLESLKLIASLVPAEGVQEPSAYKMPDWARKSVGSLLGKGIITEKTLKKAQKEGLLQDGAKKVPTRLTVLITMARAMGISPSEDTSNLKYQDLKKIPVAYRGYLSTLVAMGILSPTGSDGAFEPSRGIRRSEMAKILTLAMKSTEVKAEKIPKQEPPKEPIEVTPPTDEAPATDGSDQEAVSIL